MHHLARGSCSGKILVEIESRKLDIEDEENSYDLVNNRISLLVIGQLASEIAAVQNDDMFFDDQEGASRYVIDYLKYAVFATIGREMTASEVFASSSCTGGIDLAEGMTTVMKKADNMINVYEDYEKVVEKYGSYAK